MCTIRGSVRCLGAIGGIPAYGFLPAAEMTEHDGRSERDMNLKSGELYFINEVDVLTGVASNFYKIGYVKDSRQGDAGSRLDELQTGNPRKLVIVECVEAVAISDLENSVHNRFATRRILVEWFVLDAEELSASIGVAKDLSNEQALHRHQLEVSAELSKVESSGSTRAPDEEDFHWYRRFLSADAFMERAVALKTRTFLIFKAAIKSGANVDKYARWKPEKPPRFDQREFEKCHPDLFQEFQEEKTGITQSFRPKRQKRPENLRPPDSFLVLEQRFEKCFGDDLFDAKVLYQLHQLHLELLSFIAQAKWEKGIAEANLKALCGDCDGIEEVVTWRRKMSKSSKFDRTALKAQYPEIYASFVKEIRKREFEVFDMRSYA
jgi:hypothetical protein